MSSTNWTVIGGSGNPVGGGSGGTGVPAGAGTPPGDVSGVTCTGTVSPTTLAVSLQVSFTAPVGDPTWTGVEIWLELPDQSSGSTNTMTVGTTTVGTGTVAGPWNPTFLGSFTKPNLPLTLTTLFPIGSGLDPTQNVAARLYVGSISAITNNPLVRNGLTGATPNVAFTLDSTAQGGATSATNVTDIPNGMTILCTVLPNQTVSGKTITPVSALIGSVPSQPPKGWGYKLIGVQGLNDPTVAANQIVLTSVETVAGIVPPPPSGSGASGQYSFIMDTPTTPNTPYTVYAVAGLYLNGTWSPNNIIPGITPGCPILIGTDNGVIDASQAIASSISSELTTALGKLGIASAGINAAMLAPATALANLAHGSLTGVLFAASTITGSLIANNTITGTLLATSGIITSSAQIANGIIGTLQCGSISVSVLSAGTSNFTATATFQNGFSGPSLVIASTGIEIVSSGGTLQATSTGLTFTSGSNTLGMSSTALTITNGSASMTTNSTGFFLTYTGSSFVSILNGSITMGTSASDAIAITPGTITITSSSLSSTIVGNAITTGSLTALTLSLILGTISVSTGVTSSTASAGGVGALPSTVAGYWEVTIGGVTKKVPFYD